MSDYLAFACRALPYRSLVALGAAAALISASAGARAQASPPSPGAPYALSDPPRPEDWKPWQPIPPGYHEGSSSRMALVAGGSVIFGITYTPEAVLTLILAVNARGVSPSSDVASAFFALGSLPVLGPFVLAAASGGDPLATTLLAADGLAQAGGLAMLVAGLVLRRPVLVRDQAAALHVLPAPMSFGRHGAGFGLTGTF